MEGGESDGVSKAVTLSEKPATSSTKKQSRNTLLNFVTFMSKPPEGLFNTLSGRTSQSRKEQQTKGLIKRVTKERIDSRNVLCPIP